MYRLVFSTALNPPILWCLQDFGYFCRIIFVSLLCLYNIIWFCPQRPEAGWSRNLDNTNIISANILSDIIYAKILIVKSRQCNNLKMYKGLLSVYCLLPSLIIREGSIDKNYYVKKHKFPDWGFWSLPLADQNLSQRWGELPNTRILWLVFCNSSLNQEVKRSKRFCHFACGYIFKQMMFLCCLFPFSFHSSKETGAKLYFRLQKTLIVWLEAHFLFPIFLKIKGTSKQNLQN